jgi:hypothetical protein
MKNLVLTLFVFFAFLASSRAQESTRPAIDVSRYGGKLGIGISILDGIGVPVRYYFTPKNVVEAGMYAGGIALYDDSSGSTELSTIGTGFMTGLGYTRFGNRFVKEKRNKRKVRTHGAALRYRHIFGDFRTDLLSLGWAMETSREKSPQRSFIFELGLQGIFTNFVYEGTQYKDAGPGIYLRCHWNFFLD